MCYWKVMMRCLLAVMSVVMVACSDSSSEEDFSDVPGVEEVSWDSMVSCNAGGDTVVCSFNAHTSWTLERKASWYNPMMTSGTKGKNNFNIVVDKNETGAARSSEVTIHVKGYKSVSFTLTQDKMEVQEKPELELNKTVDEFLAKYYLWNTDYKKLDRDLTIPYTSYSDNFLKNTLMSMITNTLDKKWSDLHGTYTLYSYLDRVEKSEARSTRTMGGVNHGVEKDEYINSYGFSSITGGYFVDENNKPTGEYFFVPQSVYPSSPALVQGVKRGTMILEVDGKAITDNNFNTCYFELLSPTKSSLSLTVVDENSQEGEKAKLDTITLMPMEIDPTPIIKDTVLTEGAHKIGYLVYEAFEAGYDDDLLAVMADFKSQGVTDFVLDLRYNGGGYVVSAQMLSACIVGSQCQDKVFQYYRYNDTRMANMSNTQKETGNTYDAEAGYFYDKFLYPTYYGVKLTEYELNMNKLYVLTTSSTASASEVTINSLRGLGMDVVVIGENTNGKNVGMELTEFDVDNYSYELAPITFQYYNAKKETVSEKGMTVDYAVNDWNNGLVDFGKTDEPMLAKAIELITGKTSVVSRGVMKPSVNVKLEKPLAPVRHHREGALVLKPKE